MLEKDITTQSKETEKDEKKLQEFMAKTDLDDMKDLIDLMANSIFE